MDNPFMAYIRQLEEESGQVFTVACARCGTPCKIAGQQPSEDARIGQFATSQTVTAGEGLCANCVIAFFLKEGPLKELVAQLERDGKILERLADERVQAQFLLLLHPPEDVQQNEVNWEHVRQYWDLPFPQDKRKGGKKNKKRSSGDQLEMF